MAGETKIDIEDRREVFALFETGAHRGDLASMVNLGVMLQLGDGGARDYAKAADWFEKAAAKGDATAMTGLGTRYYDGRGGLTRDYAKARELFEKAAAKGEPFALLRAVQFPKSFQQIVIEIGMAMFGFLIACLVVSILAVLAGWLYWNAEQQRKVAEEQRAHEVIIAEVLWRLVTGWPLANPAKKAKRNQLFRRTQRTCAADASAPIHMTDR
jgi:TPR repeat protein